MRFTAAAASLAAVAGLANAAALVPRATQHKVYVDTSACADNGRTLAQIFGISNSTGEDFNYPDRSDKSIFTFTVPASYQGHVWLYDSDHQDWSSGDQGPMKVQGVDFYFYDQPTDVEKNQATVPAAGSISHVSHRPYHIPDPITAVRFASTPSGKFIKGKTGGTLFSKKVGDALHVYYCKKRPVQH